MYITLRNLLFHARHGVMPQEREVGQRYEVTARLELPDAASLPALLDDQLTGTANYADAYATIREEMQQPSQLIEHVAERMAEALLCRFPQVTAVDVELTKLTPPIPGFDGHGASVRVSRQRTLLVLDFDGTLADTSRGIISTMNATFDACGYPHATDEAICHTIGLPLTDSIALLARGISGEELEHATATYRRLFEEIGALNVPAFPHVSEVLHRLHRMGVTMAVATSRGHESVTRLCRNIGILDCMSHIIACEDVRQAKPHPEAVLTLMQATEIGPERTWVVGDTTYDIGMGRRAGARTIGVTYGNHSREALEEACATRIIDNFAQLPAIVLG